MPIDSDHRMADAIKMFSDACSTLGLSPMEAIVAGSQFTGFAVAELPDPKVQGDVLKVAAASMISAFRTKVAHNETKRR